MATLASLRTKAKNAGVPVSKVRKASADELRALIAQANGKPQKSKVRKAVKKGTVVKASAKKAPAAKSTKGKAKRPSANGNSGRNLIASVDFNQTDGWSPRAGPAPDRIIKALKKSKGNRDKAFDLLVGDVWDFVGKVTRNGEKRTKQEAHAVLMYRISRTLFDFAVQTGQHEISTNRIKYGTGPNAQKNKPKRGRPAKAQAKPAKRGRPAKKRGPGRPKGSKNKAK